MYSEKVTTTFITQSWFIWDFRTVDKTTKLHSVLCHIIVLSIQEKQKFQIKLQNIFWKLIHSFYKTHTFTRKLWKQIYHHYEVKTFKMLSFKVIKAFSLHNSMTEYQQEIPKLYLTSVKILQKTLITVTICFSPVSLLTEIS